MAPRRLRPREAAAWLAEHGCPGTVSTLEAWRCLGRGPAFYRIGRRIAYDVADLEAFAAGQRCETVDSIDVGANKAGAAGRP